MIFTNPFHMLIVIIVSLLFCIIGFKKFVWFLSVGYGLSAAAIGATLLVLSIVSGQINVWFIVQCVLFTVYGIRLGGFLLIRELKNEKYRAKLAEAGGEAKMPFFVAFFIWIICGLLYFCQTSPAFYRLENGLAIQQNIAMYIGIAISLTGIIIESLSDKQKSAQKEKNPNLPAMEGLFKMCRCPNYFGEILFWTGVFISGIGAVQGWQWLIAVLGYIGILGVMYSGTKRIETRHIKHYGQMQEYNNYADHTPLIIPLIPLYHLVTPESIKKKEEKKKR